ncbi:MAG: type II toxin-antitoxin system RelE/ParE family toxin [Nitrospirae bacterium]|uniref:type II toxin-antitoxin system RelE family toxin n=1 Tax=Candidatus Magnetobacterium casense TaxID=1455061 RepID=UPI00058F9D23|nr:type II toxin-antitoxin system RelE/ParE family toxin [Nitrospirota bacterium]
MRQLGWTEESIEDFKKLDKQVAQRIVKRVLWLCEHFDDISPETLSGKRKGEFKFKVGDWRVIYKIETNMIVIHAVGHRSEIYQRGVF